MFSQIFLRTGSVFKWEPIENHLIIGDFHFPVKIFATVKKNVKVFHHFYLALCDKKRAIKENKIAMLSFPKYHINPHLRVLHLKKSKIILKN